MDAKSVSPTAQGKVKAVVTSPSGQRTDTLVKNNGDGTYSVLYTLFEEGLFPFLFMFSKCGRMVYCVIYKRVS